MSNRFIRTGLAMLLAIKVPIYIFPHTICISEIHFLISWWIL